MFSIRSIALATTAAAALVPAVASANTYCVFDPDCNGSPQWSLQDAINAAVNDTSDARIELGAGTYSGNVVVPVHTNGLEIVGQGPDKTVLEPADPTKYAVMLHGGTLSQVAFNLPNGSEGLDLTDGARAHHIRAVVAAANMAQPVRIEHGGQLDHAHIDSEQAPAVQVSSDKGTGDASITDSYVRGSTPISVYNAGHTVTVLRDRLVLAQDYQSGLMITRGSAILEDSLIDLRGHLDATGMLAYANSGPNVAITGRHLTVLADGADTNGVIAASSVGQGDASVALSDSVLSGVKTRAKRMSNATTTLALARVDTWPAAPDSVDGGSFSDEGSFSADPLLGADLAPGAGSPLIDAAAPLGAGESDTDLNGGARTLDGDGTCDARPDIGAIEAPAATCAPPPTQPDVQPGTPAHDAVAPLITKVRLLHRRSVRFTVSEAARVTVRITRAHHTPIVVRRSVAGGAVQLRLRHALRHGRYAVRVLAVDAAGNRSAPAIVRRRV